MRFASIIRFIQILLLLVLTLAPVNYAANQLAFAPVSGQITSGFGWRTDPLGAGSRFHSGLDIAAPSGTAIYAPQNGSVVYSGQYKGYGNVVVLDHGYGLYTLYGHASALYVTTGHAVFRGQPIAAVGSTGRSTGPHLHFEVHQNGQYVNPVNYLAYLGGSQTPIAYAQPAPLQIYASQAGPIQVTTASKSTDYLAAYANNLDEGPDDSSHLASKASPPSSTASTSLGKQSSGIAINLGPKPQPKTRTSAALRGKTASSNKTAKVLKASRYLAANAVQLISGKLR